MKTRMILGIFAGLLNLGPALAEEANFLINKPVVPSIELTGNIVVSEIFGFEDRSDRRDTAYLLFLGPVKSASSWFPAQMLSGEERLSKWGEYAAGPFRVKTDDHKIYRIAFTEQTSSWGLSNDCYMAYRTDELGSSFGSRMEPVRVESVDCDRMRQLAMAAEGPELANAHSLTEAGMAEVKKLRGRWNVQKHFPFALQFKNDPENLLRQRLEFNDSFAFELSSYPAKLRYFRSYEKSVHSLPDDLFPAKIQGEEKNTLTGFVIRERSLDDGTLEIVLMENPLSWNLNLLGDAKFRFHMDYLKKSISEASTIDDFMPTQEPGVCGENVPACSERVALYESSEFVSGSALGLRLVRDSQGGVSLLITGYDRDPKMGSFIKTGVLTITGEYSER